MDRVVQCMICGKGIAGISCRMCGRVVCSKCYDPKWKVCIGCRAGKEQE